MSNEEMGIQKDLIRRYGNTVGCRTYTVYGNTGYLTKKWEYCGMTYEDM